MVKIYPRTSFLPCVSLLAPLTDSSCHRAEENYRTGATLTELRKSVLILMAYRGGGEGGGWGIEHYTHIHSQIYMWIQAKACNEGRVCVCVRALASVCVHVCQHEQVAISPTVYNGSLSPTLTHLSAPVQQPALLEDHDSLHQCTADAVSFNSSVFRTFLHLTPPWSPPSSLVLNLLHILV